VSRAPRPGGGSFGAVTDAETAGPTAPRFSRFGPLFGVILLVAVPTAVILPLTRGHSDFYTTVAQDRSWLGYLPRARSVDVNIGGLDRETSSHGSARRVDLVEPHRSHGVSLCFASSEAALRESCPGFRLIGETDRAVDLRVVGQLGEDSVDWIEELGDEIPHLEDLTYLDE
jgi:hypothetical protein